ncbi:MAG: hypothetical protein JXX29_19930 [Deltaproteobacteria bacterium]|nr:hypothetical protein [Deltaproteobacteria bacterium]MBN2673961.1 hypothetical protein [Deltaproteobacteria bacterium]
MPTVSIRAYEQKDLPLEQRLASLAKRFAALKDAEGISPFSPAALHAYIQNSDNVAAVQTGLLLLQLAGHPTEEPFELLTAMAAWSDEDRQMFINFLRVWDF